MKWPAVYSVKRGTLRARVWTSDKFSGAKWSVTCSQEKLHFTGHEATVRKAQKVCRQLMDKGEAGKLVDALGIVDGWFGEVGAC